MQEIINLIAKAQEELSKDNTSPREISDYLYKMSASIYPLGQKMIEADKAYSQQWLNLRSELATDAQAEKKGKTLPEYAVRQSLEYLMKTLIQCIQSLKKRLLIMSEEKNNQY